MLPTSRLLRMGIALALAATALVPLGPAARADAPCSAPAPSGGEWPTYGGDPMNSRTQSGATSIGVTNAAFLERDFVVDVGGAINSTPLVRGGCVVVTSQGPTATTARVTTIDAASGGVRWATTITVGEPAFGGAQVGSPALWGDLMIVPLNKRAAPFVVALDLATGAERWRSAPLDTQPSSGTNASLVVHDGVVFAGFFGAAGPWLAERGGFVLLEASTGAVLKKTFVIPDADFSATDRDNTYAGAGIWGTPAVDTATGFAYVGTSNPHNPRREHDRSNALLKIDLDRQSAQFGEIVAHYKGIHDTIVPGAQNQPVCDTAPNVHYYSNFSATCLAIDVDFGASPNLMRVGNRLLLGALQKAGVYHVVDTADMSRVSMTPVGAPCFACNAASSAFADGRAFVPAGPPGQMVAVDVTLPGSPPVWASPIAGGFTYNPASVANGVVWSVDSLGFLDGWDQATGAPVARRSLSDDTGTQMRSLTTSSGIAIAHDRLFVAATRFLVVLQPPA